MSKNSRLKFTSSFKVKVAIEAIKYKKTLAELIRQFEVDATVISRRKAE